MSTASRPLVHGVRTLLTVVGWWLIASRSSGAAAWMAIAALFVAGDVLALALARGQAAPRSHLAGAVSRVLFIASGLCIAAAVTPWTGRFSGFRPWFLVPAALLLVSHAVVDRRWRGVGAPVAER